jgi:response regulator of citrate/malate metabolism
MVSADATAGSIRKLKEQGATDYMTKPLEISKFLDVLAENLSERIPS